MLAYGTYVIAEQTPSDIGKELANRHFNKDYPKEITLPFVPIWDRMKIQGKQR